MALLFITELRDYLTPQITEELFVDTSRSNKLRINLDIVFPRVACSYMTIDAMDNGGEQQSGIDHSIFKQRLDTQGKPIEDPQKTDVFGDSSIGKKPGGESPHGHGGDSKDVKQPTNETGEFVVIILIINLFEKFCLRLIQFFKDSQ